MNSVGPVKAIDPEDQQFESEVAELLTRALRDTVYPVDFSMFSSCPRAEVEPTDLPVIYPTGFDPMAVSLRTLRSENSMKFHFIENIPKNIQNTHTIVDITFRSPQHFSLFLTPTTCPVFLLPDSHQKPKIRL